LIARKKATNLGISFEEWGRGGRVYTKYKYKNKRQKKPVFCPRTKQLEAFAR
jgi:hypothetical protein